MRKGRRGWARLQRAPRWRRGWTRWSRHGASSSAATWSTKSPPPVAMVILGSTSPPCQGAVCAESEYAAYLDKRIVVLQVEEDIQLPQWLRQMMSVAVSKSTIPST